MQFRPGHSLLKKAIYSINTNPELQETRFSDSTQVKKLRIFWNALSREHENMGYRSNETVYRTASVIARIMQKTEVDSEVVEETIDFIKQMYGQLNNTKVEFIDPVLLTFDTMRKVIKEHSLKKYWAEEQYKQQQQQQQQQKPKSKPRKPNSNSNSNSETKKSEAKPTSEPKSKVRKSKPRPKPKSKPAVVPAVQTPVQYADITFNQAAEIASTKNSVISEYLGRTFKANENKAARNLRKMFRERQNEIYEGGKILVVSNDGEELALRWISQEEA